MTNKEYINSPVGTKFLMKPNRYCPLAVWEFIACSRPYGLNEKEQYERNLIRAKEKQWHKVVRHIRNTENGHECYLCAQVYNESIPQNKRYWWTKGMHLIKNSF